MASGQNTAAQNADAVVMWDFGQYQATVNVTGNWSFVDATIDTQLRDGNWDWVTRAQHWYGVGTNTDGTDPAQTLPDSLYLTSAPAFFGGSTWPWVDPSTGATYTLPAMYCFQHNQMPTCMISAAVGELLPSIPMLGERIAGLLGLALLGLGAVRLPRRFVAIGG